MPRHRVFGTLFVLFAGCADNGATPVDAEATVQITQINRGRERDAGEWPAPEPGTLYDHPHFTVRFPSGVVEIRDDGKAVRADERGVSIEIRVMKSLTADERKSMQKDSAEGLKGYLTLKSVAKIEVITSEDGFPAIQVSTALKPEGTRTDERVIYAHDKVYTIGFKIDGEWDVDPAIKLVLQSFQPKE